jgi:hypothetical protein
VAKRDHKNTAAARDFDRVFWITLAAFAAATLLAYQPAWHGDFLWDDNGHLTKPVLRSLGGLWRIWFVPGATQQFYPVVHSAFWLQFHLWGLAPTGYHLVNVLLHACNAALLTAILRRLKVPGAVLAGAIFALHPVQVESVAWITELKNTIRDGDVAGGALDRAVVAARHDHLDARRAAADAVVRDQHRCRRHDRLDGAYVHRRSRRRV